MRKRSLLLVAILLVGVVLGAAYAAMAQERPVTIRYWADPRFVSMIGMEDITKEPGDYERLQAQRFMEMYPHVTVEVQSLAWEDLQPKVVAAIMAGNPPDVLKDYLGRTAQYAHAGLLEDLYQILPPEVLADYNPSFLDLYTINGELHALPSHAWAAVMAGNRRVWEAKGVAHLLPDPDNPRWTIDEFTEALRAVAEPGALWPLGMYFSPDGQGDYHYLAFFWGFGANLYNDDFSAVALNSPEGVRALEYLVELAREGLIQPGSTTASAAELENMMWRGHVAIQGATLGIWNTLEVARQDGRVLTDVELFWAQHPHVPGVDRGLAVGPTGFAVFKQTDDYKRYWIGKFLEFIDSPEYQREYVLNSGQFPTRLSVDNPLVNDPHYAGVNRMLQELGAEDLGLTSPKYNEVRALLAPQLQAAILGQKTPAQALADFEREANRVLQQP
ncbi:MAG: sugar ABC transporter substrate-binding protein [Limnochordales bacterium]|nr:sugar ABC transporter substrate-binding protein [Limnochordales bacterium]